MFSEQRTGLSVWTNAGAWGAREEVVMTVLRLLEI